MQGSSLEPAADERGYDQLDCPAPHQSDQDPSLAAHSFRSRRSCVSRTVAAAKTRAPRSAADPNRRGWTTVALAGQVMITTAEVSSAWTSSIVIWSVAVSWTDGGAGSLPKPPRPKSASERQADALFGRDF